MKLYSIELDTLPEYVQEALWSDDFFQFRYNLHLRYPLTEEQDTALDTVLGDVFAKRTPIEGMSAAIKERLDCDVGLAWTLGRLLMLNAILVFPEHFGNQWQYYKDEFKGTEEDLNESRIYLYLLSQMEENFKKGIEKLRTFDFEKEALQIKKIFQSQLVGYLRLTDSMPLIAFNALIFAVIRRKETFPVELQEAMLDNEEEIGVEPIVRDGTKYPPRILEWIRDLLASSDKEGVSSLSIAKYITQNPNARKLSAENREAARRLFEAYYTLKNFPDSLAKVPSEDWLVIPYTRQETEHASPARLARSTIAAITPQDTAGTVAEQIATLGPTPVEPKVVVVEAIEAPKEQPLSVKQVTEEEKKDVVKPLPTPMPPQDHDKRADEVIAESGLTITPDLAARLKTIIVTRLRNVRNDTQTTLRLMDPVNEGGIGLSPQDAEKLLDAMKKESSIKNEELGTEKQDVTPPLPTISPVQSAPPAPMVTSAPPPPLPAPPSLSIKEDENGVPVIQVSSAPIVASSRGAVEESRAESVQSSGSLTSVRDDAQPKASLPPAMQGKDVRKIPIQIRPGSMVGKVPISDVKAPPRLLDAVGELRAMTIKDFRRLSPNPVEAAGKIMTKIQLIEKDSYTKKMAGIEAWKQNEVSLLYRDIGKESFGAGVKMGDVIEKRKNEGKPYLTMEEFEALLDLNEHLRV